MGRTPITVYLDSSDYSTLSDPRRRTDSLDQVRSGLQELAKSGLVHFAFSGAHLSEMAPLDAKFAPAATARADLLIELCGRNAFISFDRLVALEVAHLANPEMPPIQTLSTDAIWYPELEDLISPVEWANFEREIDQKIKEHGLNRRQRRTLKRQLFKASQLRPKIRKWLANQEAASDLSKVLCLYPMRPQDAKIIRRYVLGQATAKEAEDAFLESLRDPRWMMRWFAAHHDELTPVTEWLRGPSRDMTARMKEMAAHAKELRRYESILGPDFKADMLTSKGWQAVQDQLLLQVANRLLAHSHPGSKACGSAELVDKQCPGLSTTIRSLHSSLWNSVGIDPRTPRESDFVDAVHAMYAPYVTFFRADRYMAPHIRKQAVHHGTVVVSRLEDLADRIHDLLNCSQ
jgi:hypothetical protein